MVTPTAESTPQGAENFPDFEKYQATIEGFSDVNVAFHPAGINDKEVYEELSKKKSAQLSEGILLSLDIEDATEIVEDERCTKLAHQFTSTLKRNETKFSALPLPVMLQKLEEYKRTQPANTTVFYFTEYEGVGKYEMELPRGTEILSLVNPLTHTEASLNMYQAINIVNADEEAPQQALKDVVERGAVVLEEELAEGGKLRVQQGNTFSEEEEGRLWELFSSRFQDISDNMPVRLEEEESSTVENIFRNPNYTFIYSMTPEEKIDCCVFITDVESEYGWVSRRFLEKRNDEIESEYGEVPYEAFVPGIAADRNTRANASAAVILRMGDVLTATNHYLQALRFECTDVSSLYIPRKVQEAIVAHPAYTESSLEKLGQKNYIILSLTT
jgi:hypothetical protein